jgi:hypothetical protein
MVIITLMKATSSTHRCKLLRRHCFQGISGVYIERWNYVLNIFLF